MLVLLDIKDEKASFFMEVLKNFSFVEAKPLSSETAQLLGEVKEAVENLNLVKKGQLQARPARELLGHSKWFDRSILSDRVTI